MTSGNLIQLSAVTTVSTSLNKLFLWNIVRACANWHRNKDTIRWNIVVNICGDQGIELVAIVHRLSARRWIYLANIAFAFFTIELPPITPESPPRQSNEELRTEYCERCTRYMNLELYPGPQTNVQHNRSEYGSFPYWITP